MFITLLALLFSHSLFAGPHTLHTPYAHGFIFEPWKGNDISDVEIKQRLKVVADTGARHVTFIVYICQKDKTSNELGDCSPFEENLNTRVRWAKFSQELGMEVDLTLFPHTEKWDEWRGFFVPTNPKEWFASYTEALIKVAIESEKIKATHLTLSTETEYLYQYADEWMQMAQTIRQFFSAPLVINVNWGGPARGFWSAVDYISMSAYYPLSQQDNASPTVEDLRASWQVHKASIKAMSVLYNLPLMFSEIGYQSKQGTTYEPWDHRSGEVDLDIQARAFEAFYLEWKDEPLLEKTMIWSTEGEASDGQDSSYNPIGKPAMEIIGRYFRDAIGR